MASFLQVCVVGSRPGPCGVPSPVCVSPSQIVGRPRKGSILCRLCLLFTPEFSAGFGAASSFFLGSGMRHWVSACPGQVHLQDTPFCTCCGRKQAQMACIPDSSCITLAIRLHLSPFSVLAAVLSRLAKSLTPTDIRGRQARPGPGPSQQHVANAIACGICPQFETRA